MSLFPLLNLLLILLPLLVVTVVAQCLKVRAVKETVSAYRPRDDVVHAGRRLDDSLSVAFSAKRMLCPEGTGQSRPPCRVVGVCGTLADISLRFTLAPGQIHFLSCFFLR